MADPDPSSLPYYGFSKARVAGCGALVSRTGYTGEDGFEIYCRPEDAAAIFRRLLEEGQADGVMPCGLGARDTLRLEAKMALYGNDIDDTVTPWEADSGWIVKMGKGDFLGRDALAAQKADGVPRKLVGFEMVDRGIARHGYPAKTAAGAGVVTSGHALADARQADRARPPAHGRVGRRDGVRGGHPRTRRGARVVATPFYKRKGG